MNARFYDFKSYFYKNYKKTEEFLRSIYPVLDFNPGLHLTETGTIPINIDHPGCSFTGTGTNPNNIDHSDCNFTGTGTIPNKIDRSSLP